MSQWHARAVVLPDACVQDGRTLVRFSSPLFYVHAVLGQNRTSNVRHLASKLHGEAIVEMNGSHLFLVLGLWEAKLMHHFLSILYFFVFKIFLWFLQQFAQKARERDGTLLSTYNVVGAGVAHADIGLI